MIKKHIAPLLIALLIGVALFTSSRYIIGVKEKYDILNNLEQLKIQVGQLETEKETFNKRMEAQTQEQEKIIKEKLAIEEALRINQEKFSQMETELIQAQKTVEELNVALATLKEDNTNLQQNQDNLAAQIEQLTKEKSSLQARLHSIKELKKAIQELKREMRRVKVDLTQKAVKKINKNKTSDGNLGYIVKNGKSTYPTRTKIIEVTPAP